MFIDLFIEHYYYTVYVYRNHIFDTIFFIVNILIRFYDSYHLDFFNSIDFNLSLYLFTSFSKFMSLWFIFVFCFGYKEKFKIKKYK